MTDQLYWQQINKNLNYNVVKYWNFGERSFDSTE